MRRANALGALLVLALLLSGCSGAPAEKGEDSSSRGDAAVEEPAGQGTSSRFEDFVNRNESKKREEAEKDTEKEAEPQAPTADELRSRLDIAEDYRTEFDHGPKGAEHQRYIVLHDTEGEGTPESVVSWWASNGNLVAAHFVIGKDGHIVQCVPLDRIAHHSGYGDTGHNEAFGITEDGRDDMKGTTPIGSSFADYGMNAWSVGIELVHVGGSGDYPPEQLEALDGLIAYIDAYYGFESEITDHKAWRSGNSDTSPEFAGYLANYQDHRTHD